MAISELTASTQNYLKCIWTLQEWTGEAVSVTALAERLGVRTSTASDGVKKLADEQLVEHETYGGVTLTDQGRAYAVAMVRRHRLIETYLVSELGYRWDEVHDEAEVLEHAVSDRLIAALDERLGHPVADPHGDPIPSPDGVSHLPEAVTVAEATEGPAIVVRVSDDDPERLRRFADAGLIPGASVTVNLKPTERVRTSSAPVAMNADDAAAVWVAPLG